MSRVWAFLLGLWDFVVGDDWRTALGVVLALGLTAAIAETSVAAWWVMPVAVLVLLALSIRRAARGAVRRS
jgi:hydrogenase/urease accessory protein HupE